MGRYGLLTRLAMLVIGAIWLTAGLCWLAALARRTLASVSLGEQLEDDEGWFRLAGFLAVCGFMLLKTAVMRDRPKPFENEVADANPKLDLWDD